MAEFGDSGELFVGGTGSDLVLAVLVEQDAVDFEIGIKCVIDLDGLDEVIDVAETVNREHGRLGDDNHIVSRHECVQSGKAERRRAVDDDIVVDIHRRLEGSLEAKLATETLGEYRVEVLHRDIARDDVAAVHELDAIRERGLRLLEQVENRKRIGCGLGLHPRRDVRLRIHVDQEDVIATLGHALAESLARGGLPHAALVVNHCNSPCDLRHAIGTHHRTPFGSMRPRTKSQTRDSLSSGQNAARYHAIFIDVAKSSSCPSSSAWGTLLT